MALITGTKHDLDGRDYKGADTVGELEELYLSMRGSLSRMVARIVPADEVEDIVQEGRSCPGNSASALLPVSDGKEFGTGQYQEGG